MRLLRRILAGATAVLAVVLYVWVAAVRAVPGVKRRKQQRRAERRRSAAL